MALTLKATLLIFIKPGESGPNPAIVACLILLAINDRKRRIEVGYGLEPILPDGKVGGFGREIVPLLKQESVWSGIVLLTQRIANVIAADAGIQT